MAVTWEKIDYRYIPTDGTLILVWDTRSISRAVVWQTGPAQRFPYGVTHWSTLEPPMWEKQT